MCSSRESKFPRLSSHRLGTVDNSCLALRFGFPWCLRESGWTTPSDWLGVEDRTECLWVQSSPACSAAADGLMLGSHIVRNEFASRNKPLCSAPTKADPGRRAGHRKPNPLTSRVHTHAAS
jgi:hypothetical protein